MELIPLKMMYSDVASKATALDAEDGLLFFISKSAKAARSIAKTALSSNSSDSIHTRDGHNFYPNGIQISLFNA